MGNLAKKGSNNFTNKERACLTASITMNIHIRLTRERLRLLNQTASSGGVSVKWLIGMLAKESLNKFCDKAIAENTRLREYHEQLKKGEE